MECGLEIGLTCVVLLAALVLIAVIVSKLLGIRKKWKTRKMLRKFNNSPKDVVIFHSIPRCKTMPSVSPFALKLETYLRLAKIPYELETTEPQGPSGKIPWITYNGKHLADSQELGINLNRDISEEQIGIAAACKLTLKNHFNWGMIQYRFVDDYKNVPNLINAPRTLKLLLPLISYSIRKRIPVGLGTYTKAEIYELTENDLRTVSKVLGNKRYFGGDDPCEDDCAIFGEVAQAMWGMPGSSYERLVHDELTNLKEYCERMKERVWPDWEKCIYVEDLKTRP